jgi:hypothetical protein
VLVCNVPKDHVFKAWPSAWDAIGEVVDFEEVWPGGRKLDPWKRALEGSVGTLAPPLSVSQSL